jgi:hypothetical protein
MTGENDEYAFSLKDETISRTEERSTCALCGFVRLWNASTCIECDRRARRRTILLTIFLVVLIVAAILSAVVLCELYPDLLDGLAPFDLLEESRT